MKKDRPEKAAPAGAACAGGCGSGTGHGDPAPLPPGAGGGAGAAGRPGGAVGGDPAGDAGSADAASALCRRRHMLGSAQGYGGPITVQVTMEGRRITDIQILAVSWEASKI